MASPMRILSLTTSLLLLTCLVSGCVGMRLGGRWAYDEKVRSGPYVGLVFQSAQPLTDQTLGDQPVWGMHELSINFDKKPFAFLTLGGGAQLGASTSVTQSAMLNVGLVFGAETGVHVGACYGLLWKLQSMACGRWSSAGWLGGDFTTTGSAVRLMRTVNCHTGTCAPEI